jgi:hypothetical protein
MPWREIWDRDRAIAGPDDAAAFVEAVGFCTWAPVPGLDFPNLAEAMGRTASSVLYDTWFWKDDLHLARRLYYGKIVRGQPTFVAADFLPDFVAALGSERDASRLYLEGRLPREARVILEYLTEHGAQPTRALRRGVRLASRDQGAASERAITELQRRFLICKVDLTGRTRGTYSYVWDLAERFWPEPFEEARGTPTHVARERIRERLCELGIAPSPALEARLLLWR